jgi:glycosyltransferase involved in cell wall biosynthesis
MSHLTSNPASPTCESGALRDERLRVVTLALYIGQCYGGAERAAYEFATRLDPRRFKSCICVVNALPEDRLATNEAEFAAAEAAGVEVWRLNRGSQASIAPWVRLRRLLARESIDVLHSHMPRASVPGTIIAHLAGVPVIVNHEHSWSFEGKPLRRFLDRNVVARGSNAMVAVSERDRDRIIEIEHIAPDVVRVLPNGVPPMATAGAGLRDELGIGDGEVLVGAVARLYPEKGNDHLVRAVGLLRARGMSVHCALAGQGPEEDRLRALIAQMGVEDSVHLLGHRVDVAGVIRDLDVAVLPSISEGSPLALMEYMACSAAIVASDVGGVGELVHDGVHALLVPPADPEALAGAIQRLIEQPELARRLGAAAGERQRASYDVNAVVRRLEELYLELSAGVGRGRATWARS